ncbi:hypothetical protein [Spongiactinospora sp. 9N601]|uniref:hypothetical protein n=1 Tax=Spongiactinospora sp. 9N601 TaxID=3375149 RepID=UPI00379438E9
MNAWLGKVEGLRVSSKAAKLRVLYPGGVMILGSGGIEPGLLGGPVLDPPGESGSSRGEAELGAEGCRAFATT